MKTFETVDSKLNSIGFIKIEENKNYISYERKETLHNYIQRLDLWYKNKEVYIQSYQKGINTDGFNNMVALTAYEAKLVLKKIKKLGWK